ncbi:uroporphyrinogen decarboxylase family protein, partial [bacterium]|nr:uroporphyrinogen decarboxylase family protein [bacterium]
MRRETFDRLFTALQGQRCARGPMIAADHLAVLIKQPLGEVCRRSDLLAEGLLYAQRLYHSDFIIVFSDVSVEPEALGVLLEYFPDTNPQPAMQLKISEIKAFDYTRQGRIPVLLEAASLSSMALPAEMPIFVSMKDPFSLAAMAIGTERFLELMITGAARIVDLLEKVTQCQSYLIDNIVSNNYIPFIGAPIASGGLIGRNYFRRFAMPYLEKLLARIPADNFRCLHICGEIGMLGTELADLNLDLLSFEDWHEAMWKPEQQAIAMGFV